MNLLRQARSGLQSVADYVFGFDFFVSYAHAEDASAYARRLAERLEQRKYNVCLDQRTYHAGHDISALTRRYVRNSNMKDGALASFRAPSVPHVDREQHR